MLTPSDPAYSLWRRFGVPVVAGVLAAMAFGIYRMTLAPSVLFGDSGEFQFVPFILGIAHPTGYPLYVLLGYGWSHLIPVGDVAFRMNLLSAVFGAATVGLMVPLLGRMLALIGPIAPPVARWAAAVAGAATFGVGLTFWRLAIVAEVYTLHTVFVTLVLLLTLAWSENGWQWRDGLALALVCGLGLTHHRTTLLLFPGVALFLWLSWRETKTAVGGRGRWPWARIVAFGSFLVLPCLLYLMLPLRAPHVPYVSLPLSPTQSLTLYDNSWRGFRDHVLASVFTGSLAVTSNAGATGVDWLQRLGMIFNLLRGQFGWTGLVFATLGVVRLVAGRHRALLALLGLGFGLNVAFNLAYLIGDVEVLFLPAHVIVCCCLSVGLLALGEWVPRIGRILPSGTKRADNVSDDRFITGLESFVPMVAWILPVMLCIGRWSWVDQSTNRQAEAMWRPILEAPIPTGAVLLSNDRDEMMPLWYYQFVEGRRPDLLGLFPGIVPSTDFADLGGLIDQVLPGQRPAFLVKPMPGLEVKVDVVPAPALAPLVRISAMDMAASPEHEMDGILGEEMRLSGYDLTPASMQPGHPLTVTLFWQTQKNVERDYSSYVHLVNGAGESVAQDDHRPGGEYYPTSSWRAGEMIRDQHLLQLPRHMSPGVYHLESGMYSFPGMVPLGDVLDMGLLALKEPGSVAYHLPLDVEVPVSVSFGDKVALLAYDRQVDGPELWLTVYWQAQQPLVNNWSVFVHVTDSAGGLVAQQDGQPREGTYPTSIWDEGEIVSDPHRLVLPANTVPGEYSVSLGLYLVESGERLPVFDDAGQTTGDTLRLFSLSRGGDGWRID